MLEKTGELVISCEKPGYQLQNKKHDPSFHLQQLPRKFRMALNHSYSKTINSNLGQNQRLN